MKNYLKIKHVVFQINQYPHKKKYVLLTQFLPAYLPPSFLYYSILIHQNASGFIKARCSKITFLSSNYNKVEKYISMALI